MTRFWFLMSFRWCEMQREFHIRLSVHYAHKARSAKAKLALLDEQQDQSALS